jgi:transcriptional regulator with GAF, ATPase, and Fis domain
MSVTLVSIAGPLEGQEIPIQGETVCIGSDPANHIQPGNEIRSAVRNEPVVTLRREDARYLRPHATKTPTSPSGHVSRDLKCLLHAAEAISSLRELEPLAARILELLGQAIPADHGAIVTGPRGPDEWQREFHWSRSGQHKPLRVPREILRRIAQEKVPIWSNNLSNDQNIPPTESSTALGVSSLLAVPLIALDTAIGAIYLHSWRPAIQFDEEHLQLLTGFARITAGPLNSALRVDEPENEKRRLEIEVAGAHGMVGRGLRMRQVYEFVRRVADCDSTVLIGGESGTGKELVARALHIKSRRAGKPFMAINCAALTESLLESEMFGHEKGAFTGAVNQKKGRIEEAAGGTLFLDEVGELAPALQAKLLRVLQEREFERVGGSKTIKADIRLIAASNRNLKDAVAQGAFRWDLYFRLNVISTVLPPLRERREDIPDLVQHFIRKYATRSGRRVTGCSPETIDCLQSYDWPGNVRELENAIECAIVMGSTSVLLPEDLPETVTQASKDTGSSAPKFNQMVREMPGGEGAERHSLRPRRGRQASGAAS